jgi:hypothetical protein
MNVYSFKTTKAGKIDSKTINLLIAIDLKKREMKSYSADYTTWKEDLEANLMQINKFKKNFKKYLNKVYGKNKVQGTIRMKKIYELMKKGSETKKKQLTPLKNKEKRTPFARK